MPIVAGNQVQNPLFDNAQNTFNQAKSLATPSAASLDTAAARVRSRLAGRERATEQSIRDQFQSAGRGVSGGFQQALSTNRNNFTNEFAKSLTDLQLGFEDRKNQAAQTLLGIGQGESSLGLGQEELGVKLEDISKSFELGQGDQALKGQQLELEADKIQKTEEEGIRRAIIDALGVFIEGGNTQFTPERGELFDSLLQALFASTGNDFEFDGSGSNPAPPGSGQNDLVPDGAGGFVPVGSTPSSSI